MMLRSIFPCRHAVVIWCFVQFSLVDMLLSYDASFIFPLLRHAVVVWCFALHRPLLISHICLFFFRYSKKFCTSRSSSSRIFSHVERKQWAYIFSDFETRYRRCWQYYSIFLRCDAVRKHNLILSSSHFITEKKNSFWYNISLDSLWNFLLVSSKQIWHSPYSFQDKRSQKGPDL